jgi:PiT family inorganic phosphate transporter
VAGNIIKAWILTLPAAGAIGAVVYWVSGIFGSGALGPLVIFVAGLSVGVAIFARHGSRRRTISKADDVTPAPAAR